MAFERETATFRRELPRLLANPTYHGKFALVHRDRVAGVFPSPDAALDVGYLTLGLDPFLIQEVTGSDARAPHARQPGQSDHDPRQER